MKATTIKAGTRFLDSNFITHTIVEIDADKVIHSYKDGKRIINDGFMYRSVFDKLVANQIIWIL